jgi:2-methylcitrate dehydratase PrpD
MSFGARVRIELEDGRTFEAEQEVPFGGVGRPFDDRRKSVEDKFRRETRYTLRKEKMERAIDMVLHLEQSNSAQLRELVRACCSERG